MLLSDRFHGYFMVPEDDVWNYNFMGVKHNAGIGYKLKMGVPLEYYHELHRPSHFLTFTHMDEAEDAAEADVQDVFA
jgi:pre-mRNA-processing factor 8